MKATARVIESPLRPAEHACVSPDGRIEFRIQRELKNFNSRNRHPHWAVKNKGRLLWQASLCNALVNGCGLERARTLVLPVAKGVGLFGACGTRCQVHRTLTIIRWVPSPRNFVRDTFDNLPWATKELRDAIKNLGLIRDDSSTWTTTTITQDVSLDGSFWTWVAIGDKEPA